MDKTTQKRERKPLSPGVGVFLGALFGCILGIILGMALIGVLMYVLVWPAVKKSLPSFSSKASDD